MSRGLLKAQIGEDGEQFFSIDDEEGCLAYLRANRDNRGDPGVRVIALMLADWLGVTPEHVWDISAQAGAARSN